MLLTIDIVSVALESFLRSHYGCCHNSIVLIAFHCKDNVKVLHRKMKDTFLCGKLFAFLL